MAGGGGPGRRRVSTPLLAVLCGTLAVAVVLLALLVVRPLSDDVHRYDDQQHLATTVAAAARRQAATFTRSDWRHPSRFTRAVLANSTPGYRRQALSYAESYEAGAVRAQASSSPDVLATAVISATPQVASALVILDVHVRNRAYPGGVVDRYRLQLDLQRTGGAWLVAGIEPVS